MSEVKTSTYNPYRCMTVVSAIRGSEPLSGPSPGFFFNDPATTEIYTLSLHDALPISYGILPDDLHRHAQDVRCRTIVLRQRHAERCGVLAFFPPDRKSTRRNSSHTVISYAVFCLKKKRTRWPTR